MVELAGAYKTPKSAILKLNNSDKINMSNLSSHTIKFALLKSDAIVDMSTVDTFTGNLATSIQDYSGYETKTLTNVSRVDTLSDGYVWVADDVTFEGLYASVQYGVIYNDNATKDILAILDLGEVYTFAGDITFDLNVHGFFGIKV